MPVYDHRILLLSCKQSRVIHLWVSSLDPGVQMGIYEHTHDGYEKMLQKLVLNSLFLT